MELQLLNHLNAFENFTLSPGLKKLGHEAADLICLPRHRATT